MTFARLRAWDWVAFIAALALLFVSAADWYSTTGGDEARRLERLAQPNGALGGEVEREVQEDARVTAEGAEKNAWQVTGVIDRVILAALLATVALGVLAAFAAASTRVPRGVLQPAGLVGLSAALTSLLVLYRIVQEPGFDGSTTVKLGAPLALVVLGVLAFASAGSLRTPRVEAAPWEKAGEEAAAA